MSNRLRKHAKRHEDGGLDEIDLDKLNVAGDIDITGFRLKIDTDLYFQKGASASRAKIVNNAGTFKDLEISTGFMSAIIPTGTIFRFRAPNSTELARMVNTYWSFTIGDIRMSALPGADPADGLSKLWSNGGVVTVGT